MMSVISNSYVLVQKLNEYNRDLVQKVSFCVSLCLAEGGE